MRGLKVLLTAGLVAGLALAFFVFMPFGSDKETFVEITPGMGTVAIAERLSAAGVVRSAFAFEGLKKVKGLTGAGSQTLKAGEYRFDHAATITEVYDRLRRGDVYTMTLVVPEGFNLFDIAGAVEAAGLGSKEEFLAAARAHTELIAQWSPGARSLEGYLFPDTYKFGRHITPVQMLTLMVKRFGVEVGRLGVGDASEATQEAGSSPFDKLRIRDDSQKGKDKGKGKGNSESVARLVTMASLVEKEVHVDAERAEVASVFRNRLAAGMPLQTDPAVIYASMLRGTWTGVIHQSELHSDSAYNTYAHVGLPPGPICSPGLAALRAVLHPADTDYLYFVADANGATRFAATLKEHDANVASYRKK